MSDDEAGISLSSLKDEQVLDMLNACDWNRKLTSETIGCTEPALRKRISRSKKLAALAGKNLPEPPDSITSMNSDPLLDLDDLDLDEDDQQTYTQLAADEQKRLAEQVMGMDLNILTSALKASGVSAETVDKIARVANMDKDVGVAFALSLKWTNGNAVRQQSLLIDMLEKIMATTLNPESPEYEKNAMERLEWVKTICKLNDSSMKASDRVIQGNEILVKLLTELRKRGSNGKSKGKDKPGFGVR